MTLAEAGSALDRRLTNSDASDGLAGRVTDSKLVEELNGMHCVRLELGSVTDEGVVLVKGARRARSKARTRCSPSRCRPRRLDGLTAGRLHFSLLHPIGPAGGRRPPPRRRDRRHWPQTRGLTAPLDSAIRSVLRTEELALLCDSCGVPLVAPAARSRAAGGGEAARSLVGPELAAATLAWAGGSTFFRRGSSRRAGLRVFFRFEGTFVRALRSLDEYPPPDGAARTLGDTALSARLGRAPRPCTEDCRS